MDGILATLQKKIGGVPVWLIGLVGVAGLAYYLHSRAGATSAGGGDTADPAQTGAGVTQGGGLSYIPVILGSAASETSTSKPGVPKSGKPTSAAARKAAAAKKAAQKKKPPAVRHPPTGIRQIAKPKRPPRYGVPGAPKVAR